MPGPFDEFDLEIEGEEPDGETPPRAPKAAPASHEEMVRAYDRERRRSLHSDMEEHGALSDLATLGLSGVVHTPRARAVTDAEERMGERGRELWDSIVLGDERLGGRNTVDPIVGRDRRPEAGAAGVADAASLGFADELGGLARSARSGRPYEEERDDLRERQEEAAEQAPGLHGLGELAGTAPYMLVNPASASGRIGLSAGLGAASGLGHSEAEDAGGMALDTLAGGGLGAGAGVLGEGVARALAPTADDALRRLAATRDDRLLAATTSAGRGQSAVRAFDRGETPAAVRASRERAAQALRETEAIPRVATPYGVSQSIDRAMERPVSVMEDVSRGMDGGGPSASEVASRLRRGAGEVRTAAGRPRRDVLEDYAAAIEETYAPTAERIPLAHPPERPVDYRSVIDEAADLRSSGAYRTRGGREISLREDALRQVDQGIRGAYDDAVEETLGAEQRQTYERARQQYASLIEAQRQAALGQGAEAGNRALGLTELAAIISGGEAAHMAGHGPLGYGLGLAAAGAARGYRAVEPTARATLADLIYQAARSRPTVGPEVREALRGALGGGAPLTQQLLDALQPEEPPAEDEVDPYAGFDLQLE